MVKMKQSTIDKYIKLLPEIYKDIKNNNGTIKSNSEKFHLNQTYVSKFLKETYGYESPCANYNKGFDKEKELNRILKLSYKRYKHGESITNIAKDYKIKRQTLSKKLKEKYNLTILQNGSKKINENFFEEKSDKSFYWLGYIYADGSINISRNELEICSKDKSSIMNFKKDLKSEHKIITKIVNNKKYYKISIKNKKILDSLISYGIMERKSFTKIKLPELSDKEFISFIRGYIDGDGTFYCKRQSFSTSITIGLVNYDFAQQLSDKIEKVFNIKCAIYKGKTCYMIMINKIDDNIKFAKILYANATRYLNRKYNKVKKFV